MPKKTLLIAAVMVPLLALTACGSGGDGAQGPGDTPSASRSAAPGNGADGPDLSGIPDVVATVDGHDIPKSRFVDAYKTQYQQAGMQGQEPNEDQLKKQVVETLVGTQLLLEEADRRGYTSSAKQVDDKLGDLAKQYGMDSGDDFLAALEKQGVDKKEAREEVEEQVKLDQVVSAQAGDTTPSDKELHALYDQFVQQQKQQGGQDGADENMPSFEEAKPQLEQHLRSQKENAAVEKLVTKLRKDAKVTINL